MTVPDVSVFRAVAALTAVGLMAAPLAGCDKKPAAPPKPSAATAVAYKSPDEIAKGLLAKQNFLVVQTFKKRDPMVCASPGAQGGGWVQKCAITLTDPDRGDQPARVEFLLYDHDVAFATEFAPVKQQLTAKQTKDDTLVNQSPRLSTQNKAGEVPFDASCHQLQGAASGPAVCGLLFNPRMLIVAETAPARSAIPVDAANPATEDLRHSSDLALMGVVLATAVN